MRYAEWFIALLILGVGFIGLGIYLVSRGKSDEGEYFVSLAVKPDVRKYLERRSLPAFISLKVGGRISIIVGIALLILGGVLWYLG